jgi:hypothetical protein
MIFELARASADGWKANRPGQTSHPMQEVLELAT